MFVWEDWRNPEKAQSPIKLPNTRGTAFQIAFSREGDYLVGSSDDGVLRMWATNDAVTASQWQEIGQLRGHKGPVWAIVANPKDGHMASGSTDGSIISWSGRSAFQPLDVRDTPDDDAAGIASTPQTLASCIQDLALPNDFAEPIACVRSPRDRAIVAWNGRLAVFDNDPYARGLIDTYKVGPDVVGLTLNGNRLIVRTRSGSQTEWPFFDSLDDLIGYSLDHLPFNTRGHDS